MARARVWLLPHSHPAAVLREAARVSPAPSWWQASGKVQADFPGGALPDVVDVDFLADAVPNAVASPGARKALLRRYKREVVQPRLRTYDQEAYATAADRILPGFGVAFSSFQPLSAPGDLLDLRDLERVGNLFFRLWAVCRITGRWPLPVLGGEEAPITIDRCGACPCHEVSVVHAFTACAGTAELRGELWRKVSMPPVAAAGMVLGALFGPARETEHIRFVARAILACGRGRVPEAGGGRALDSAGGGAGGALGVR